MKKLIFSAIVRQEDAWYVAECPEVGTISQGKTWSFRLGANKGTVNVDNFGRFAFESIK